MKEGYVSKAAFNAFVGGLTKRFEVWAPVDEGGTVFFRRLGATDQISLDRPAYGAPKGVVFPQSETFFTFVLSKDPQDLLKTEVALEAKTDFPDTVIVAGRPCDAAGFAVLDRVFMGTDPYYAGRRERTTIMSLVCEQPFAGCFCTSVGGGPAEKAGSDVLLTDLGEGYYIEALSAKGEEALKDASLEDGASRKAEAEKRQAEARDRMKETAFDGTGIDEALFDSDDFWKENVSHCLGCGACTYLCPTCQCFNITDEQAVVTGERIRSWDSCMFGHFTREASGHNPRPGKAQRFRNRVGHKFIWARETYGSPSCTGCGRCIRMCPVSMDISRIVKLLAPGDGAGKKTALEAREEQHAAS